MHSFARERRRGLFFSSPVYKMRSGHTPNGRPGGSTVLNSATTSTFTSILVISLRGLFPDSHHREIIRTFKDSRNSAVSAGRTAMSEEELEAFWNNGRVLLGAGLDREVTTHGLISVLEGTKTQILSAPDPYDPDKRFLVYQSIFTLPDEVEWMVHAYLHEVLSSQLRVSSYLHITVRAGPITDIPSFDEAFLVHKARRPSRDFAFKAIIDSARLGSDKPPLHFHPHQEGYYPVRPWVHHRVYHPPTPTENNDVGNGDGTNSILPFVVSAQETKEIFNLDIMAFQNWYVYQDEVLRAGAEMSLIKVLNMYNAGGTYFSLP
ncbi:hypothetical protein F4818DRAFT_456766 [Hypoxylon cercidicola]|nr:hypothetical protein F4818DRAFT_456766 [Hypoxylon cercidicola]